MACTGKAHEAGGIRRQLAGQFLDHRQRAEGVVFTGEDEHGTPDGGEQTPGVEARDLVTVVVHVDISGLDGPAIHWRDSSAQPGLLL